MSELIEQIKHLASTTYKTNREIAKILGCSRRTVRRHAGPWEPRVKARTGETEPASGGVSPAKILLFDIETSPLEVYAWGIWKQLILPHMIKKNWSVLSWAAKWLFEPNIMSQCVRGTSAVNRTDSEILTGIWDLLNEADIVIAHNGNQFDIKRLNARFAQLGMKPPMPYRTIDTLRTAKRVFSVPSFKLDDLNKEFGLSTKIETGMDLWKQCCDGNEDALQTLRMYNERDVTILEELYLRIRPWIKSHPNVNLYVDTDTASCTNCGNKKLTWGGQYITPAGRYDAFRCDLCGAIGRSRHSNLTKEDKERLLLSVAS